MVTPAAKPLPGRGPFQLLAAKAAQKLAALKADAKWAPASPPAPASPLASPGASGSATPASAPSTPSVSVVAAVVDHSSPLDDAAAFAAAFAAGALPQQLAARALVAAALEDADCFAAGFAAGYDSDGGEAASLAPPLFAPRASEAGGRDAFAAAFEAGALPAAALKRDAGYGNALEGDGFEAGFEQGWQSGDE